MVLHPAIPLHIGGLDPVSEKQGNPRWCIEESENIFKRDFEFPLTAFAHVIFSHMETHCLNMVFCMIAETRVKSYLSTTLNAPKLKWMNLSRTKWRLTISWLLIQKPECDPNKSKIKDIPLHQSPMQPEHDKCINPLGMRLQLWCIFNNGWSTNPWAIKQSLEWHQRAKPLAKQEREMLILPTGTSQRWLVNSKAQTHLETGEMVWEAGWTAGICWDDNTDTLKYQCLSLNCIHFYKCQSRSKCQVKIHSINWNKLILFAIDLAYLKNPFESLESLIIYECKHAVKVKALWKQENGSDDSQN